MTGESTNHPSPTSCTHPRFSKVEGTEQPDGSFTAICTACGTSRSVKPPRLENAKGKKPLLLE